MGVLGQGVPLHGRPARIPVQRLPELRTGRQRGTARRAGRVRTIDRARLPRTARPAARRQLGARPLRARVHARGLTSRGPDAVGEGRARVWCAVDGAAPRRPCRRGTVRAAAGARPAGRSGRPARPAGSRGSRRRARHTARCDSPASGRESARSGADGISGSRYPPRVSDRSQRSRPWAPELLARADSIRNRIISWAGLFRSLGTFAPSNTATATSRTSAASTPGA